MVIAGCGFLGEAAAVFFSQNGWRVLAVSASEASAARLREAGFDALAADITGDLSGISRGWAGADAVIHCASSGRGGEDAYRAVYRDGLDNLIRSLRPGRILFTGSTSVYSQSDGAWVDEGSLAEPDRATGRILLEAERIAIEAGGVVARLAGIYGPGRSVLLRKFLDGTAVLEAGGGRWINQIHRDDGARALFRLAQPDAPGGIYNVCDDTPATQRDVYGWIAGAIGRPLPPEGPADLNRKRGWTSKRVSNSKLRSTGWQTQFPSYAAALPSLIDPAAARYLL